MAWSTRELAELAGTTVNTVRHYHRLGLLPEPERRVNNYKQYGVPELVQLLRIRRLVDIGVPLAQISESSGTDSPEVLETVDAQLAERIAQLERARADIAAIRAGNAPLDGPRGFEAVAERLTEADSSILHISSRLYDERALADLRKMVEVDGGAFDAEFNVLPAEADEPTRARLAEGLAPALAQHLVDYPWLLDPVAHLPKGAPLSEQTFIEAVVELYNQAQLDVLARASVRAHELLAEAAEARGEGTGAVLDAGADAAGGPEEHRA